MQTIAAILTCFNRKVSTLSCLENLMKADLPPSSSLAVYLVDDQSMDGTREAVRSLFPSVHVLTGNGNLFWGGGMRLAFERAMAHGYDLYLWLNDDVELAPDALVKAVGVYSDATANGNADAIVVGATFDPSTGRLSYSGRRRKPWLPLRFVLVEPDAKNALPCDTSNGNFVLVPASVANKLGNIDPRFTHQLGDFDYGLRARRAGAAILLCPGYVGTCKSGTRPVKWQSASLSFIQRLAAVQEPLGLPFGEFMMFAWRHGRVAGLLTGLYGYRNIFFPRG